MEAHLPYYLSHFYLPDNPLPSSNQPSHATSLTLLTPGRITPSTTVTASIAEPYLINTASYPPTTQSSTQNMRDPRDRYYEGRTLLVDDRVRAPIDKAGPMDRPVLKEVWRVPTKSRSCPPPKEISHDHRHIREYHIYHHDGSSEDERGHGRGRRRSSSRPPSSYRSDSCGRTYTSDYSTTPSLTRSALSSHDYDLEQHRRRRSRGRSPRTAYSTVSTETAPFTREAKERWLNRYSRPTRADSTVRTASSGATRYPKDKDHRAYTSPTRRQSRARSTGPASSAGKTLRGVRGYDHDRSALPPQERPAGPWQPPASRRVNSYRLSSRRLVERAQTSQPRRSKPSLQSLRGEGW